MNHDGRQYVLKESAREDARSVLYIMSRDQRVQDNHALLAAQAEALEHGLPLIVAFNLLSATGFRKREHYQFMVDGLKEVEQSLRVKNISFVLLIGKATRNINVLENEILPRTIYFDFSPLRGTRAMQKSVAAAAMCSVVVVDTHNVVPIWVASTQEEFAAHTLRRKLHKLINQWAVEPPRLQKHPYSYDGDSSRASWQQADELVATIEQSGINHSFNPGEAAALLQLAEFTEAGLPNYATYRNDPNQDTQSNLSPYLHYGQVSSLRVLLEVIKQSNQPPQLYVSHKMPSLEGMPTLSDSVDSFVEELVVRKELSDNFCFFNIQYDSLDGARDWAKKTLADHSGDPREFTYTEQQLERAETHDELWNAAQLQLTTSGKIHGYMRMYWAKKILEWIESPERAIQIAIRLNDTYHLDGGDPNGYVGILWSIAGVHDRPWFNRSVYGTIRYMNANGAKTKFDTQRYIEQWTS